MANSTWARTKTTQTHLSTSYAAKLLTKDVKQQKKGKSERNDRLFAVPRGSHAERDLSDVRRLSSAKREELEKFFIATDELEDKQLKILGWKSPKVALKAVKKGIKAFQRQ